MTGGGLANALVHYLKQDLNWPVSEGASA
jgi:hypothetical protein